MYINQSTDGRNNICGTVVVKHRKWLRISQRGLANRLKAAAWTSTKCYSVH